MTVPDSLGQVGLEFVQRLLGPVGEAGEILSDKIRFYRWKSSLKVIEKARKVASDHKIDVKEIPLKFLIPFMEKSSLEEEESPLIDRWANLLADAAAGRSHEHIFVDILSSLSSREVTLLEKLVPKGLKPELSAAWKESTEHNPSKSEIEAMLLGHQSAVRQAALRGTVHACNALELKKKRSDLQDAIFKQLLYIIRKDYKDCYIEFVEYFSLRGSGPNQIVGVFSHRDLDAGDLSPMNILLSKALLERDNRSSKTKLGEVSMTFLAPTPLALAFVSACRGDDLELKTT